MGGAYGVPCPTLQIGTVTFPWALSVTSSEPTSSRPGSRDHQDATEQSGGREDTESWSAVDQSPAAATSRDQSSAAEDYGITNDDVTWRKRSGDSLLLSDADATGDVVTSQPEPEIVTQPEEARKARRIRFRDAAISIASQFLEDDSEYMLEGAAAMHCGTSSTEEDSRQSGDVSTRLPSNFFDRDRVFRASGGRSSLLEELLRQRARTRQLEVGVKTRTIR